MLKKTQGAVLQKNQIVELEITGMTGEGSGVGRYEGMAVFVPYAAVGDLLRVKILKTTKAYAFGKIESILTPSPDRIPIDCPHFPPCGGCVYRHIGYEAECRIKEQRVRDAIERIGGFFDLPIRPVVGAKEPDHYRNKAQLPLGRNSDGALAMGFYASHSHRIVPCGGCLLQPRVFEQAMDAFRIWEQEYPQEVYDEASGKGRLRHLYLREARATGQIMVCVVVNGGGFSGEERLVELLREHVDGLESVVINSNREKTNVILGKKCRTIGGNGFLTDILCGLRFRISPLSFYQVNRDQAERLYQIAAEYAGLTGEETLLDLYCGTGTIGLTMAHRAKRVIGVELVEDAVEDARRNAQENGIANAEFFCGDAGEAADMLARRGEKPDVVLVDPPRKGCAPSLVETIVQMCPKRIVYVSCDPATLARDLKGFAQKGYRPVEATPVDLFPRTAHCECVAWLEGTIKEEKTGFDMQIE